MIDWTSTWAIRGTLWAILADVHGRINRNILGKSSKNKNCIYKVTDKLHRCSKYIRTNNQKKTLSTWSTRSPARSPVPQLHIDTQLYIYIYITIHNYIYMLDYSRCCWVTHLKRHFEKSSCCSGPNQSKNHLNRKRRTHVFRWWNYCVISSKSYKVMAKLPTVSSLVLALLYTSPVGVISRRDLGDTQFWKSVFEGNYGIYLRFW